MAKDIVLIKDVSFSKNPVKTGEAFIVSVTVNTYEPERPRWTLPFRLGFKKGVR